LKYLRRTDPEAAQEYEDFVLKKNEYDEIMTRDYDLSEVKIYPGSDKGPLPEDDPRAFSRWFAQN
jgi:hypothetical protein